VLAWGAYNSIIGHEGIGTVVQTGVNVSASMLGKRVGIKWLYRACTECSVCQAGFANNCAQQLNTSRHVPGTLQQYTVADARFISMIPDGVSDEVAAPLLCAGLTMSGALDHLDKELQPGDWVVISGSGGGLGHIGVQIAARVKKLRVIAVDSGDAKRKLSLESGAEAFIDFKMEDVAARVLELTGEGAHATVVVPGTKEAFATAPTLVRNMGHIITVGLPRNDIELPISATLCAARGNCLLTTTDHRTLRLSFADYIKHSPSKDLRLVQKSRWRHCCNWPSRESSPQLLSCLISKKLPILSTKSLMMLL
jgi:propanol-preferring alcohol dehydrogenase